MGFPSPLSRSNSTRPHFRASPSTMQATVSPRTTSSGEYETMNTDDSANRPTLIRRWRWLFRTWLLLIFASAWISFTICLAWNSTLTNPFKENMLPSSPILVLSIPIISVHLLQVLASHVFERLRWALASRKHGVPFRAFLAMSPAARLLGLLYLLPFDFNTSNFWT